MFSFEGAVVFAADRVYYGMHEVIEMRHIRISVESLVNKKMQVAIFSVPEYCPIGITKISEEVLQICHTLGQAINGEDYIFVDRDRSWRTHPADGGNDPFTRLP